MLCLCLMEDMNLARSGFWIVTHGRRAGHNCDSTADNPSPHCCWGTGLRARTPAWEPVSWALPGSNDVTQHPCFQFLSSLYPFSC